MKKLSDQVIIKNIKFKSRLVLAPMAGVTDASFRKIVASFSNKVAMSTEMLSDHAYHYENPKTFSMIKSFDKNILSAQIFGSNIDYMVSLAKYLDKIPYIKIIDINMGCPVPKVANRAKAGSYWLKEPKEIYKLVKAIVDNVSKPVSVKIRSGYDNKHLNYLEVAKEIERAGASFITIHPRSKEDGYMGHSNWEIIKEIKANINIPVIGNGDIHTYEDAIKMLNETNCDLVMIGREAQARPYIFKSFLTEDKNHFYNFNNPKLLKLIIKHYYYLNKEYSPKIANLKFRTYLLWYFKGNKEIKKYLMEYFKNNDFKALISNLKVLLK